MKAEGGIGLGGLRCEMDIWKGKGDGEREKERRRRRERERGRERMDERGTAQCSRLQTPTGDPSHPRCSRATINPGYKVHRSKIMPTIMPIII